MLLNYEKKERKKERKKAYEEEIQGRKNKRNEREKYMKWCWVGRGLKYRKLYSENKAKSERVKEKLNRVVYFVYYLSKNSNQKQSSNCISKISKSI